MRHTKIIAIPLRHQNASFSAEASWNFSEELVVVCIFLLEYIECLIAREIYAFVLRVKNCVVHHADSRQLSDDLAIVRIQHNQLARFSCHHKQAMVWFIEGHRHICFVSNWQRPGG